MSALAAFKWSLRREIWEHRVLYLGPAAIGALVLLGFAFNFGKYAVLVSSLSTLPPMRQAEIAAMPLGLGASVVLLSGWLAAAFYAVEALHAERRDRSILFWKSLPVSDRVTVLSKLAMPLLVMPVLCLGVAFVVQALMLALTAMLLAAKGLAFAPLWERVPVLELPVIFIYGMAVHALWYAPAYAWMLMVSAWAKRAAFAWAFLPFFAAFAVERITFGSNHVGAFIRYRIAGAMQHAFQPDAAQVQITALAQLTPLEFLAVPWLWAGIAFAAACAFVTIELRRRGEPI